MHRTKLSDRLLPRYSRGEELVNMLTHIAGCVIALIGFALCLYRAISHGAAAEVVSACVYGISMIALYAMSSIYHGLLPGTGKKVLQVLDHCTIYFLIAGTYTPIVLCALCPAYPAIGWGLLVAEWTLAALATALTAIDLKRYRVFSMICYIGMGWAVIFFMPQALEVLTSTGFGFLLAGGIAYTVGAVLFGLGKRIKWMHSWFHIFVVLGSVLQLVCILVYVL